MALEKRLVTPIPNMKKEIEVKFKVADPGALEEALARAGSVLGAGVLQEDTIYINYDRPFVDFKPGDIFLRIRKSNGKNIFTFKQGEEMKSVERETEVGSAEQLHDILTFLGFRPEVNVTKRRRKGIWKGYEVCLDEVENLGTFIELEKITDEDSDLVQEAMVADLHTLGVNTEDRVMNGYDTLQWLKDHQV
jgi:adenylate cyclase class 2